VRDTHRLDFLRVRRVPADNDALLTLIELVAAIGVIEEIREVREQAQGRSSMRPRTLTVPSARARAVSVCEARLVSDCAAATGALAATSANVKMRVENVIVIPSEGRRRVRLPFVARASRALRSE